MRALITLTRSTIGLKLLMAVSGAGALLWLLLHMLGNLQAFAGASVINLRIPLQAGHPFRSIRPPPFRQASHPFRPFRPLNRSAGLE